MGYQMQGPMGERTIINGRERDYFAGCGYLGLQNDARLVRAASDALQKYGLATAGGLGNEHPIYAHVGQQAQAFFDTDRSLYFGSGYLGNAILAQGLRDQYDHIFVDELAHYSVWDGARTSGKPVTPFRHRDPASLAEMCRQLKAGQRPLVMSDGVFPISGEIAPIPAYLEVVHLFNGLICIDDAHATGVLGDEGRGTLEYFHITDESCHTTHTLSKALGSYGGLITGDDHFIDTLIRCSPVQIGASLPPLPMAAAAGQALMLARSDKARRQQLRLNVAKARSGFRALGWPVADTPVPIICLGTRSGVDLVRLQAELFKRDIAVAYTQSYSSTPEGGALRVAVFATHTAEQIDRLVNEVGRLL